MNLDEFQQLQRDAEHCRRDADRSAGALQQLEARLRTEHGCKDAPSAERKLAELRKEEADLERRFHELFARFKKKWKGKIE